MREPTTTLARLGRLVRQGKLCRSSVMYAAEQAAARGIGEHDPIPLHKAAELAAGSEDLVYAIWQGAFGPALARKFTSDRMAPKAWFAMEKLTPVEIAGVICALIGVDRRS